MDIEEEHAYIHNVFSSKLTELDEVIKLLGSDIKEVTLGFTPKDGNGYKIAEYHEEDCTLFVKNFKIMEMKKLRIPSLSHA